MIGRYMAAARGPKNAAAKGGVSTKSLKSGTGSSGSAQQQGGSSAVRPESNTPKGNMAGFEGGKSAYIQSNGSGYGRNSSIGNSPKVQNFSRTGALDLRRRGAPRVDVSDMRKARPLKSPTAR